MDSVLITLKQSVLDMWASYSSLGVEDPSLLSGMERLSQEATLIWPLDRDIAELMQDVGRALKNKDMLGVCFKPCFSPGHARVSVVPTPGVCSGATDRRPARFPIPPHSP